MEKKYTGTYKVVKIFRKSGRREVIRYGLSLEEAQKLTRSFPDQINSMVVFYKQFTAAKFYK